MSQFPERTIDVCAREIPWVDWAHCDRDDRGRSPAGGVASGVFARGISVSVYRTGVGFGAEVVCHKRHGFGDTVPAAVAEALVAWRPVASRDVAQCAVSITEAKAAALKAKMDLAVAKDRASAAKSKAARIRSVAAEVNAQIVRLREVETTQPATEPEEVSQ